MFTHGTSLRVLHKIFWNFVCAITKDYDICVSKIENLKPTQNTHKSYNTLYVLFL